MRLSDMPDWPELMKLETAAAFCELPVATFARLCPVQAVTMDKDGKVLRWQREKLRAWIGALGGTEAVSSAEEWLRHCDERAA
jgi:hypothetical protein